MCEGVIIASESDITPEPNRDANSSLGGKLFSQSLHARHILVGIDSLFEYQVQLLAPEVLARVFETGPFQVTDELLQGGPHEIHHVHEPQARVDVDLLLALDDRFHQYPLVECDVLFLIAGDAAYVTR